MQQVFPWAHPSPKRTTVSRSLPNFLQGSQGDRPTNRPTDHATQSFTIGCIYLRSILKERKGKEEYLYKVAQKLAQFFVCLHFSNTIEVWRDLYVKFSPDSDSEIILKIDQYLVKLKRTKNCSNFLGHPV